MSSAAPPEPPGAVAAPPAAPPATAVVPASVPAAPAAPARRASRWADPAIVAGTAGLLLAASLAGTTTGGVAGITWVEIAVLLAGGALTAAALVRGRGGVPGGWSLAAFGALAALTALSIAWAIDPPGAWLETNRTVAYLAAFAGAASLAVLSRDRTPAFVGGLLLGVSLVCAWALGSKIAPALLNESERFARLREPFGYWNAVGLAGALAVPGALWLGARRDGRPLVDALAFPTMTLAVTTMLLAYSRGSLLAAAAGAVVWFALVRRRVRGASILLGGVAAAAFITAWTFGQDALTSDRVDLPARAAAGREMAVLVVAVLLLAYVGGLVLAFVADLRPLSAPRRRSLGIALLVLLALTPVAGAGVLATTDQGLKGSISTAWRTISDPRAEPPSNEPGRLTETSSIRARYWDDALRMLEDRTATGFGAGGYATVRTRYRRDDIDVRHAHGYIPQTLADLGLVGLALSLLVLGLWVLAARAAIRRSTGGRRTALVTVAAIATVFGAHSLIDWTWFTAGTALVGLLAAGWLAGSAPALRGREPRLGDRARVAGAAFAVVVALVAAWSAWQPLRAERATDRARELSGRRQFEAAREQVDLARSHNPLSADPLVALATIERRSGDERAAERALERAVNAEPANYATWVRLAEFRLFAMDEPRAALDAIRAAVYLNPRSFTVVQRYLDVSRTIRNREAAG